MGLADRRTGCTEQSNDLGRAEKNAADQSDVAKATCKIVEFAAEDQHGAGDRDRGKRNEARDRTCDRLLDLLQWRFPWKTATARGRQCST
jgi:hypothetical protein